MLTTLRIKNLALVEDLTLELQPGLNVITGETGAGKSIILGALDLVLGDRADRTLLRTGADSCTVEAAFDLSGNAQSIGSQLEANGLDPCEGGQLVLKRSFTAAGANRQFVNGSPTTLNVLAALGDNLVDMHGPHDHQSLLHPAKQLSILDAFGDLAGSREDFAGQLLQWSALEKEKAALVMDEAAYAQQLDLLRFQVNEIASARLQPDEEAELEKEYQRASNAARLMQLSQAAIDLVGEDENSLLNQTGLLGRLLQDLQRTDERSGELSSLQEQISGLLGELQTGLSRYADTIEVDPARLLEIEERLNLIKSLERKYGSSVEAVMAFGGEAGRKLDQLEQREALLQQLQARERELLGRIWKAGAELSARRRKLIPRLKKAVQQQLADLGFRQSHFDVALQSLQPGHTGTAGTKPAFRSSGLDELEFQFAPNPGEAVRPLRAIASSGEMARVMLALKTVLAAEDEIPVLVFDEVDANVGGETAAAVGQKMLQIAGRRQVLCITHLAPVAAYASAHYLVTKSVKGGRTNSDITLLDKKARVSELARMLGGQGEAARKHAEALLGDAG